MDAALDVAAACRWMHCPHTDMYIYVLVLTYSYRSMCIALFSNERLRLASSPFCCDLEAMADPVDEATSLAERYPHVEFKNIAPRETQKWSRGTVNTRHGVGVADPPTNALRNNIVGGKFHILKKNVGKRNEARRIMHGGTKLAHVSKRQFGTQMDIVAGQLLKLAKMGKSKDELNENKRNLRIILPTSVVEAETD